MGMLEVRAKNGRVIEGSDQEWIAAIIQNLPPDLAERVLKTVEDRIVAYRRPGSHILHAEPFHIGVDPS